MDAFQQLRNCPESVFRETVKSVGREKKIC